VAEKEVFVCDQCGAEVETCAVNATQDGENRAQEPSERSVWLAEFELLVEAGREYFSLFLKAFGLYIVVVGAILKFFFDAPRSSQERTTLFVFGASIHLMAIIATWVGRRWYRPMAARCKEVGGRLDLPDVYYPGTVGVGYAFLLIEVVWLIAWIVGLWDAR
jgi:hypothetical protein